MANPATVEEFKDQFDRDFIYGEGLETVRDKDVQLALDSAVAVFNTTLWLTEEVKIAYLYASAHFLVSRIQSAGGLNSPNMGKGIDNRGSSVVQSKSVGQVSLSYAINEKFKDDPILSQFLRTDYGQMYLSMLSGRLVGNLLVVPGYNDTGGPNAIPNT
jgi:Protein of unknown function (DUF4054)